MIWKGWRKTWPGSTRSVSTEEKCGLVAGAEDSARVVAARVRRCALHTQTSKRSSVVPAPCAAACLARVAAKFPLCPRRAVPCKPPHPRPPVRRACVFAVGTMAVTPSVVALLTPETRCCRARDRADVLSGVRRVLLARARPSSAVRSVTPLASHGLLLASLRGRLHRRRRRMFAPLSIGQHSPAHAPRGRASNAGASTSCIDPPRKARDRAVAPRPASPPGQQPAGLLKGQRRPP
jgi:hypothetical protein